MRRHVEFRKRPGATLAEAAITISVFMVVVVGMLDMSMAVLRYNTLSMAARAGARQAIVHGSLASSSWGPSSYSATANTNAAIPNAISPYLAGMDPSTATITVTWLDSDNSALTQSRVQVTLTAPYTPMTTLIFGGVSVSLSATSTMYIAH
jgi:Flp pilus assembly protein TadG